MYLSKRHAGLTKEYTEFASRYNKIFLGVRRGIRQAIDSGLIDADDIDTIEYLVKALTTLSVDSLEEEKVVDIGLV
mgnify:CR=1 FL=1